MGKKRDAVRKCRQIRKMIDAKQYTAALEMIETIDLREVPATEDLYLFADLYERAGRIDRKKDIYYCVYERTHASNVLYHLLKLVIRMGDMQEAEDLFAAFEVIGGATLETYELRYRIARAEGRPRSRLIEILEELKREEYTEEWGYQLALLYEQEGERQKCIQECKDLKLWFGEGRIVDKAMQLKERCEDKDWEPPFDEEIPEPVEPEEYMTYAYAAPSVSVQDMDSDEEEPQHQTESTWEAEFEHDQTENTSENVTELQQPAEDSSEPESVAEQETAGSEEEPEEDAFDDDLLDVKAILKKMLPKFGRSKDKKGKEIEEVPSEPEELVGSVKPTKKEQNGQKEQKEEKPRTHKRKKQPASDELEEILYQTGPLPTVQMEVQEAVVEPMPEMEVVSHDTVKLPSIEEALSKKVDDIVSDAVSEPKIVPGTSRVVSIRPQKNAESLEEMLEDPEDISSNGIHYRTLKSVIHRIKQSDEEAHFVFAGGEERITLAVARRLVKELNHVGYASARGIGKTSAEKVNEMTAEALLEKVEQCGGCMLVTKASELSGESAERIVRLMEQQGKNMIVMLAAPFDEMDSFLSFYPALAERITYKIRM